MATATTTGELDSATITTTEPEQIVRPHSPTLVLELHRPTETGPRVQWAEDTIDNEFMNKKKSKCCCIYSKPHDPQLPDEQSTNEYDNCEHCRYHTESDFAGKAEARQPKVKLVVGPPK